MKIKEELSKIVGEEHVSDQENDLLLYASDYSLSPPSLPSFVVRPGSAQEISKILKWCNKNGIPVVPVSSRIHFYGATIPKKGGIVIDLSRMEKIHEIDTESRFVRFEPGVTWAKLYHALKEKGMRIIMPLTPHAKRSPLTDILEREVPTNVVYEYGEPLQSLEVVWPQGEIFRCGSASVLSFPYSPSKGVNPSGPGLDFYRFLQGAQGTFGIVTWISAKIELIPKMDKIYFAPIDDLSYAIDFLYRILPRRIGQECLILNNVDLALMLSETLSLDFESLRKNLPPWMLILVISGPARRPEEKIAYEEKLLKEVAMKEFPKIDLYENLFGYDFSQEVVLRILREPWPEEKKFWKFSLGGGFQSIFFITRPLFAPIFVSLVDSIASKFDYPPSMIGKYVQPIEHNRACQISFDFFFNPNEEEERSKIRELMIESCKAILSRGGFFTRPYGELAKIVYEKATTYANTLRRLKKIFDPNNIMNPSKLCF